MSESGSTGVQGNGLFKLPSALIRLVMAKYTKSEEFFEELAYCLEIRERAKFVAEESRRIFNESQGQIKALRDSCSCDHRYTEYHGDPSGGSDSHETCLVCGEIVR